jgi:ABC-2 type transport system permease protein
VILIVAVCAVGVWGGTVAGGATLPIGDAFVGAANTLFVVALFLGLSVLLHGARPELGLAIAGGAVAAAYLLTFLGPIADLPGWLLDLSPIRHLALAPSEPVAWVAGLAMTGIGALAGVIGFAGYARRDLR